MDDSRVSLLPGQEYASSVKMSGADIDRGLAEAEYTFRRYGLPVFSLGHDRRYRKKAQRVVFGLNMVVLAVTAVITILSIMYDPLLWSFVPSALTVPIMLGLAYYRWLSTDPEVKRSSMLSRGESGWFSKGRLFLVSVVAVLAVIALMPVHPTLRSAASGVLFGLLGASAVAVAGGVVAVLFHVAGSLVGDLTPSIRSAFRETPLLIPALLLVFVTDDAWRLFGQLSNWRFALLYVVLMFTSLIVVEFILKVDRDRLYSKAVNGDPAVVKLTELHPLVQQGRCCPEDLTKWERVNLYVALTVSAALRLLLIGVATAAAMLLLGLLLVDESATASLLEREPERVWVQRNIWGIEVYLTEYLFKLSLILGSFAALYFAVTVSQPGARKEDEPLPFIKEGIHAMEQAAAIRPYYLAAHDELHLSRSTTADSALEPYDDDRLVSHTAWAAVQPARASGGETDPRERW